MIRHRISPADLLAKIPQKWLGRAKSQTRKVIRARRVAEGDGIWSEIKSLYMELQGFKCMYCEKPMPREGAGGTAAGKVEYDVEHFRPKNRVTSWPTKEVKEKRGIDYAERLAMGETRGYVRLAFDPLNYGVSCKTCNSELKGDRFPITGTTNSRMRDRAKLDEVERPCLLLPVGESGEDPEVWLEWLGPTVRARTDLDPDTMLRARALVDFLELDTRADLLFSRCTLVVLLWDELEQTHAAGDDGVRAREFVARMTDDASYFAACARAFRKLYDADRPAADRWRRHSVLVLPRY